MNESTLIAAQAKLHHVYFLGLQLMVASRKGPEVMGEWMFRLFRRQHEAKFLASFNKLGLASLPDAVACAQYHVLSNNVGGVGVEYMYESDRKAWVRFRYPRWMYDGAVICGIPEEVSHGFLRGWYAQNGVSLGNPNLGFVCVSEDVTGEYGLCGYFYEYDQPLQADERLQFAKGQLPPVFDQSLQPRPPVDQWSEERLAKANRNYALEYVRNGLCELAGVLGMDVALDLGQRAARLIGLQYFRELSSQIGEPDGDLADALNFLTKMMQGMGDRVQPYGEHAIVVTSMRAVRGLEGTELKLVQACWIELFRGALQAQRQLKELEVSEGDDGLIWRVVAAT